MPLSLFHGDADLFLSPFRILLVLTPKFIEAPLHVFWDPSIVDNIPRVFGWDLRILVETQNTAFHHLLRQGVGLLDCTSSS